MGMNNRVCMRCAIVGMGKGVAMLVLMSAKQSIIDNKSTSGNHYKKSCEILCGKLFVQENKG